MISNLIAALPNDLLIREDGNVKDRTQPQGWVLITQLLRHLLFYLKASCPPDIELCMRSVA